MRAELMDGYYSTYFAVDCPQVRMGLLGPDDRPEKEDQPKLLLQLEASVDGEFLVTTSVSLDSVLDLLVSADNADVRKAVADAFGFQVAAKSTPSLESETDVKAVTHPGLDCDACGKDFAVGQDVERRILKVGYFHTECKP